MKKNKFLMLSLFVGLGTIGALFTACNSNVESKPNFIFKPAPNSSVAAKIMGKDISMDELTKNAKMDIYEEEMKIFEIKMDQVRSLLLKNLIDSDSRKGKLSNDEFLEKYITSSKKPTDKDIEKFIAERKIPKQNVNDMLKERIRNYLEMELKKKAIEEWMAEKTKKNPVEIYFSEPKRPIFDVAPGNSPSYGSPNAKVTIIEFSEFECPFCSRAAETISKVRETYKGKIRLVFKHFPLSFHQHAKKAAEASMCAHEQKEEKFWDMHDALFKEQDKLDEEGLKEKAKKVGLDMAKFESCLKSGKFAAAVEADIAAGEELGLRATPTFFINGQMLSGALPFEEFAKVIDEELKK